MKSFKVFLEELNEAPRGYPYLVYVQHDDPSGKGIASGRVTTNAPSGTHAKRYVESDLKKKGLTGVKATKAYKQGNLGEELNEGPGRPSPTAKGVSMQTDMLRRNAIKSHPATKEYMKKHNSLGSSFEDAESLMNHFDTAVGKIKKNTGYDEHYIRKVLSQHVDDSEK